MRWGTFLGGYFPKAPQIQAHTRMSMSHCVNKLVRTITHTVLFAYSLGEKEGGSGWYSVCQAPLVCKEHNKDWKPRKHLVRRKECNFVFLGQKLFCKFKAALYLTSFLTLCENWNWNRERTRSSLPRAPFRGSIVNNLHFVENCLSECVVNGKKKDKLFWHYCMKYT